MSGLDALWAGTLAALITFLVTPVVAGFAVRVGAIDQPKERGLHDRPTPRLGGLAIFAGVLIAGMIWLPGGVETRSILLGAAAITAVGLLDDIFDFPAWLKLLGQIGAALIPVAGGVYIDDVTLPFVGAFSFGWVGPVLTVIGIVGAMNAVNFTDGVDGLAAGVCTIAAITFAVIALSLDREAAAILAAVAAGASIGFLYHNFHPASVFMGDSGSNLLGFLLAVVAVQGVLKTVAVVALFFPLVILAVPILDSSFVIAKRIKHGTPIHEADSWHFHHRFANIGFSQRKTVLYLYTWTLALAGLALALRFIPYSDSGGRLNAGWFLLLLAVALIVLAASIYLIVVLEILKLKRWRGAQLRRSSRRRGQPAPEEAEIEAGVAHELETGEFEALPPL